MDITTNAVDFNHLRQTASDCALLLMATGYEDRACAFLKRLWPAGISHVLLLRYSAPPEENERSFDWVRRKLEELGQKSEVSWIPFDFKKSPQFAIDLEAKLRTMPIGKGRSIWIDISGLTNYGICMALQACRKIFPYKDIKVFYTEAEDYYPSEGEYRKWLVRNRPGGLENLPPSLTSEMSENLILDGFSGFTLRKDPTCLILYAGYEKHRSIGVIESINPSKLVIIYGLSPDAGGLWRSQMSKELHATLVTERVRAEEEAPLCSVGENMRLLTEYYDMLYDDHNICIAPICSKMQAVATYLIWERFRDIQLAFPLPVHYLALRSSIGARNTYQLQLPSLPGAEMFSSFPAS